MDDDQPMTNRPLTIDETIEALGVSDKTVRRMLKEGILVEYDRDARGRILITPESIRATAEQLEERRSGDEGRARDFALASQADALNTTVDRFTQMIDERDGVIRQLTEELATLRTERKYLPSPDRVRELEQRIAELEAQLSVTPRPVTDQAMGLERKGWLRRLLGL